jgi:predicted amino acid racemase
MTLSGYIVSWRCMMYPKVNINLNKLAKNIQVITELCQKHNI